MGFLDIFRMGKVIAGTVKHVREQRSLASDIAALPMPEFVSECVSNLNKVPGNWEGRARAPNPAAASIARQKNLPAELAEFYAVCDGLEAVHGEIPAAIVKIADLHLGGEYEPPLSERLGAYWNEYGNDSDKPGLLSVIPPDSLAALAVHAADCYLDPALLALAMPLCEPEQHDFVVVLLADAGKNLPKGTVLDVEGGSATRYQGVKAWLGSTASLFGSMADRFGAHGSKGSSR